MCRPIFGQRMKSKGDGDKCIRRHHEWHESPSLPSNHLKLSLLKKWTIARSSSLTDRRPLRFRSSGVTSNEERVEPWSCSSSISAYLVITPSKITTAAIL